MSTSTLQAQAHSASPDALDTYLRAWELVNGYVEPSRPSVADMRALGSELSASFAPALGQERWDENGEPVLCEGRTFRLSFSPGTVGCRSLDARGLDARQDRQAEARRRNVDIQATRWHWVQSTDPEDEDPGWDEDPEGGAPSREVTEWSKKSRARMVRTLATLDYSAEAWPASDGALAMVTLTLPGDWETVAPTGRHFKKMVEAFRQRWRRALGKETWRGLWKLEFQGRGAPHLHALMRVPALVKGERFEAWLSRTWAAVVAHPDPEQRRRHELAGTGVDFSGKDFSDPRRIALYFLGHSAKSRDGKEYQHVVPELWQDAGKGPGRFWGYWGLERAEVELDLGIGDFDTVRRELRKAARARAYVVARRRAEGAAFEAGRPAPSPFEVRAPKLRRSMYGGGGGLGGGWVLLNDGPAFARQLVRYLATRH